MVEIDHFRAEHLTAAEGEELAGQHCGTIGGLLDLSEPFAQIVVEGLRALDTQLKSYLLTDAKAPATPDVVPPAVGEMGPKAMAPLSRTPGPVIVFDTPR